MNGPFDKLRTILRLAQDERALDSVRGGLVEPQLSHDAFYRTLLGAQVELT
jgi:hypothetical protein